MERLVRASIPNSPPPYRGRRAPVPRACLALPPESPRARSWRVLRRAGGVRPRPTIRTATRRTAGGRTGRTTRPPPLRSPAHSSSAPAPRRRRDARGAPQPKMYDVRVCAHDPSKITPTSNGGGAGAPIAVFKLDAATCVPRPVLLVNRAAARGGERRRRRRRRRRASPGNGRWSTMVAGWWSSRWWWWCGAATVR